MERRKLMPRKIVGKSYIVYDAQTITVHHNASIIFLATKDKQEAIKHASNHGATVYSYDICEDGELINATFIYHLAKFVET
jgi:hypothetical protein